MSVGDLGNGGTCGPRVGWGHRPLVLLSVLDSLVGQLPSCRTRPILQEAQGGMGCSQPGGCVGCVPSPTSLPRVFVAICRVVCGMGII